MKLITGQGNPGDKYDNTRHNVGWLMLDKYAAANGVEFTSKPKFHAQIAEINSGGQKVILVKPTTFYNETGLSVRALADFYKLSSSDILAIHDDVSLPFGSLRIREKGSDAGNHGIKSLNAHLDPNYWRIKIGIYNQLRDRMHDADFVLSRFSSAEAKLLNEAIYPPVSQLIDQFIKSGLEPTSLNVLPLLDREESQSS